MNKKALLKGKAALSIVLLIDFVVVMITGILLYLHTGPHNVGKLHTISGFLMGVLVTIHIILNFKLLMGEITGKIEIRIKK
ncbi:MAG: DUF4405 domain-containing protein [Euryarchaeota archaeon]|nr:DUF4405 domain-containing protein [Euryarchaeota archaeon]